MNRNGSRAASRSTKPKKLIRPPRASAARSAVERRLVSPPSVNARRPNARPSRPRRRAARRALSAGSAASAITSRTTAAASSSRPSGTSNTSSSWTWSSIRTPSSPASASASSIRAIARLIRSALVPWIGALIAARSAPARMIRVAGADVGEVRLAAEQGAGEAVARGRRPASRRCNCGCRGSARNSGR